jgi:hypothetical protein
MDASVESPGAIPFEHSLVGDVNCYVCSSAAMCADIRLLGNRIFAQYPGEGLDFSMVYGIQR